MPVSIRLAQSVKKKNRTFRVIVADSRSPRDGKYIEDLGYYDPHHNPSMVEIDVDKAVSWLDKGAQPSERAQKILEISHSLKDHYLTIIRDKETNFENFRAVSYKHRTLTTTTKVSVS